MKHHYEKLTYCMYKPNYYSTLIFLITSHRFSTHTETKFTLFLATAFKFDWLIKQSNLIISNKYFAEDLLQISGWSANLRQKCFGLTNYFYTYLKLNRLTNSINQYWNLNNTVNDLFYLVSWALKDVFYEYFELY